ncbi:MAG TPA: PIG-L family deacetylase [Actinomycetota bacterium]
MTTLTLMAVHAHPDDEAIGTGGLLARCADEGIRTVLVTCTNGELGDQPGGVKPDHDDHDPSVVVAHRRAELERSCEILRVTHLEMLGYHDSGMMGWPQNDLPHAFWNTPLDEAAAAIAALMETYRPHVVVTYDENGFYGHPDHIQANRATLAAAAATAIPSKVYYTAVSKQAIGRMARHLLEVLPEKARDWQFDPNDPPFGVDESEITTVLDVSAYTKQKRASMAAHASQSENIEFLEMPEAMFDEFFGVEAFVRYRDETGAPVPETDLFAGLH